MIFWFENDLDHVRYLVSVQRSRGSPPTSGGNFNEIQNISPFSTNVAPKFEFMIYVAISSSFCVIVAKVVAVAWMKRGHEINRFC